MHLNSKIYVAGHNGMVGSAIDRLLKKKGYTNLIKKTSSELDLRNQTKTDNFFKDHQPEYVFLAAAKVGGILANNNYKADFLYDNLMIEANIIHAAANSGVKKLLFLGSSCIYPKFAPQPIKETALLSAPLEPTNQSNASPTLAERLFISAMPTNLYGPNDNFDLSSAHVLPALIAKAHQAKLMRSRNFELWG